MLTTHYMKQKYNHLTIHPSEECVKRLIAVILDDRLVLIVSPRHMPHTSIQERLGFPTVNNCRQETKEKEISENV